MEIWQAILTFGIIAIVFDVIWSSLARTKGYTYSKGAWVSFLLYAIAGGVTKQDGHIINGLISGIGVAGIDATIGWWASWVMGPGRLPETISKEARPGTIAKTIVMVMLIGAVCGILGAFVKFMF